MRIDFLRRRRGEKEKERRDHYHQIDGRRKGREG